MTQTLARHAAPTTRHIARLEIALLCGIVVSLVLRLRLLFTANINWDEFFYLSHLYRYEAGTLVNPLQTFHVHLFRWLPIVADNEVHQILAARGVSFALGLAGCVLIYRIARFFISRPSALFAVLCYVSLSNVIEHGASFRVDPFGAFLFLGIVYLILRLPRVGFGLFLAGVGMALSLMFTIKAVFHLPVIVAMFLTLACYSNDRRTLLRAFVFLVVVAAVALASFYSFHRAMLPSAESVDQINYLSGVAGKVIITDHLVPRLGYLLVTILENPVVWSLLIVGIFLVIWEPMRPEGRSRAPRLVAFTFLLSFVPLLFYRNAFPYFYVFIMAPGILFCGVLFEKGLGDLRRMGGPAFVVFLYLLIGAVIANGLLHHRENFDRQTAAQEETIRLVHALFPEPVAYIDRCSMISSYPQVGFFMSSWGLENYLAADRPIFRRLLAERRPAFLLANVPALDLSSAWRAMPGTYSLLKEDFEVLRDNFIHHWGVLYVAGKRFEFAPDVGVRTFEILIPGIYTLEADDAVSIDGVSYSPGRHIALRQKTYEIVSRRRPATVVLRWGKDLYKPPLPPSEVPIFTGF